MRPVPVLIKMRSVISDDGRLARFFLMFKGGQNAAFALSFDKIGLLLTAIRNVIRTMTARVNASEATSATQIAEGLADPMSVRTVAAGKDLESGARLLWIETIESGAFAFRLTEDTKALLVDALCEDKQVVE